MKLPSTFGAGRRRLLAALSLIGLCQAGTVIGMSLLLSTSLSSAASVSALPPAVVGGLLLAGGSVLLLRAIERAQAERLGQLYVAACRSRLFRALNDLPIRGGPKVRYGIMMTRMISDLSSMKNWIAFGVAKLVVAGFSMTGIAVALYVLDPALSAVSATVFALLLGAGAAAGIVYRRRVRLVRRLRGRLAATIGELAPARGLPRHFGRLKPEAARLRRQSRDMIEAITGRSFVSGFMRSLSEMVLPLTLAGVALGSNLMTGLDSLPVATLVASLFLIALAAGTLRDMMLALEYRANFRIGRERLLDAFSQVREQKTAGEVNLPVVPGPARLRLRNVRIEGAERRLDVALAPGETALVTGVSGSGKSSLLCAIARMAELGTVPAGIEIDGCDVSRAPAAAWHRRVKLLSPDLPLLAGSLSRNVRYGNPGLSDDQVRAILVRCRVDVSASWFPRGLQTRLEEGARALPSALRSRIALARAVAAEPGLIAIDDPNFLLDPDCRSALRELSQSKTLSILVAAPEPVDVIAWHQHWSLDAGVEPSSIETAVLSRSLDNIVVFPA